MEFSKTMPEAFPTPETFMGDLYFQAELRFAEAIGRQRDQEGGLIWLSRQQLTEESPAIIWFRLGSHQRLQVEEGESFDVGMLVVDASAAQPELSLTNEPRFFIRKEQYGSQVATLVTSANCLRFVAHPRRTRTLFGKPVRPLVSDLATKLQNYYPHPF